MKYILKLYVSGDNHKSRTTSEELKALLDRECPGSYELEVVDIIQEPQQAEDAKILATPALIRQLPPPVRKIIGDIVKDESIFLHLDIVPKTKG